MTDVKSIIINQYGDTNVLILKDHTLNQLKDNEALIRNVMIGVNFVDIFWRNGFDPQPLPFIPGLEAAGMVEAVGKSVTMVKPGDRVAFARQPGAYSQATIVSADSLIPLPDDISFEEGAAFPLQGMTAHYLIHDFRKPTPNDVVLIHAAAGGVGLLLVQWARHLGAHVIATVSNAEKAKATKQAGAHDIILYTEQDFAHETMRLTNNHGADIIIDGVGKTTFNGNLQAAALRGHIIIFGAASGAIDPISPNSLMGRSLSLSGGDLRHFIQTPKDMLLRANAVIEGIQAGWLTQTIFQILPLADAGKAQQLLENRQTIGKILLSTT